MKVLHHQLTPIYDVYEVLRCLEHEKSSKTFIHEDSLNCSGVGLEVLMANGTAYSGTPDKGLGVRG